MDRLIQEFTRLQRTPSDINEHLGTLRDLASECGTVAEFGVRGVVSSWALLRGLAESTAEHKAMVCVDISDVACTPRWKSFAAVADAIGVPLKFVLHDSATCDIPSVDLLFIDTFHVYGHLARELHRHAPRVNTFIAMHDTAIDADHGEAVRCGWDIAELQKSTGYSEHDLTTGLSPAIHEFLEAHKDEWEIMLHVENNNGLTILRKKNGA